MADRLFAGLMLVVAVAYAAAATKIQTSFLGDPVGPKLFPIGIATAAAIACLFIIFKPTAETTWPDLPTFARILVALAILIAYTYLLKPLGFVIPTALVAGGLSFLIAGHVVRSALTGVGLAIGLYVVFRFLLGLSLLGFPKSWFGV